MSKTFDRVNIHMLTHKLHQSNIPHTIIKYMANYIKGRKAYTTFRNKTSTHRQFKNGVPQGGVLSPTLFNIYTSNIPAPQAPVKLTTHADDITITSTHNDKNIANANIQSYLHEIHTWTQTNNLILNPDMTACTPFTPDTAEYSTQLELQIDNITLPMNINPKILGLTLDSRLTTDTNTQHRHDETHTIPIREHLQLHASQHNKQHPDVRNKHHTTTHTTRQTLTQTRTP